MAFFQNSVLKKYLATQDQPLVKEAYASYQKYFHHPQIRENIRAAKEEQFQEGFLRELFVNILGYTINPNPDYDLTTELKNIKDAKKTDGAILKDGQALAVIELKGTDTKDLEKIRDQAFNYKNNQPECVYVITSNFEKLRFYIDNAVDFLEFNILGMQLEEFKVFWLLLHKENLLSGIPKKIKEQSLLVEEQITKQLYADYSAFKQELWQDMVKLNAGTDELELYKKSQKLLDRFLFIFFAEDKGLLPPNSIMEIVTHWNKLRDLDEYRPLYQIFKKYFGYLNTGRVQPGKAEIHAYNGGLFAPDPILDALEISDQVLEKHVRKLTEYDFESEVDTNILGHIFEHSLNDIENVRAQLAGEVVDRSKTKRKRDGVFYTPKYITKYIVDNTLGKLCTEKKAELDIIDEDFAEGKRGRQKKTIQRLKEKLDTYRSWLLQLTICDPACGSGAFLNQVLEFLMAEHRYVDELESQLFDSPLILPNVENHILENNIFGVDINEESVQIARLSLWLRTAKKGRKLSSLNSNIKVGNSLIDDPEVAGDLAFNWSAQFPKVFAKGGFDVVVGNPPYVRQELIDPINKKWLSDTYLVGNGTADLYVYFYEKSIRQIITNGYLGFITPNKFYKTKYGKELRKYLQEKHILQIIDFFELPVFEDASTDSQIIIIRNNQEIGNLQYCPIKTVDSFVNMNYNKIEVFQNQLSDSIWVFLPSSDATIIEKLNKSAISLGDYVNNQIFLGIKTAANNAFIIDRETKNNLIAQDPRSDELIEKYVSATDIQRYHIENSDEHFLINTRFDLDISKYPAIFNYLSQFDEQLRNRTDKGVHHFNLRACSYYDKMVEPKIMYIYTAVNHNFKYDEDGFYVNNSCFIISNADKFLSAWLNSSIFNYYKRLNFVAYGDAHGKGRVKLDHNKMKNVPIPILDDECKKLFVEIVDLISERSEFLNSIKISFLNHIKIKFPIEKPSGKLQNWPSLDFKGFLGELKKAKVQLSLGEEAEWMAYFNEQKSKAQALQSDITRLDREIDNLVYELYGLTEEEIKIVEGGEG